MLKNYHGAFHSTVSDNENLDEDENLLEELDDKQLVSRISNMEVQEQALKEKVKNNFPFLFFLQIKITLSPPRISTKIHYTTFFFRFANWSMVEPGWRTA